MSSPFASLVTETVPIEKDPPHTATIRKLTAAASSRRRRSRDSARVWPKVLRSGVRNAGATIDFAATLRDPLRDLRSPSRRHGGPPRVDVRAEGTPAAAQIADLDDDTIDLLARAILRLSKPALFRPTGGRSKEAEALAPRTGGTRADAA